MNLRILASTIPIGVFYLVHRIGPPWMAILAGFIASAFVYYYARRDRLIGFLTLFGFIVVGLSAVIGIIWQSEKAYLASGPVSDFLFIGIYLGSIAIGHPLVGGIARELVPSVAGRLPHNAPVFVKLSVLWAVYDLFHGISRVYMLREWSVGEYIVWSRILNWPISTALIAITAWAIYRAAKRDALEKGEELPSLGLRGEPAPSTIPAPGPSLIDPAD